MKKIWNWINELSTEIIVGLAFLALVIGMCYSLYLVIKDEIKPQIIENVLEEENIRITVKIDELNNTRTYEIQMVDSIDNDSVVRQFRELLQRGK